LSNNDQNRNGLLRRAFQPLNSPGSIALAIMMGIVVGVIPKFLLDPWFHEIGYTVLTDPSLKGFWESMAQSDTFIWLQLNNTVVTGSLVASLVALLPGYFICKSFVVAIKPVWNRILGPFVGFTNHPPAMSS